MDRLPDKLRWAAEGARRDASHSGADEAEMLAADAELFDAAAARVEDVEAALRDIVNSYEDERARIKAGNADRPSVSGQTFIDRAKRLLAN